MGVRDRTASGLMRLAKVFGTAVPAEIAAAETASGMDPATPFGPGKPLGPYDGFSRTPRSQNFVPQYNVSARPRSHERIAFSTLQGLIEAYDIAQMCVWHRIDSVRALEWSLVSADGHEGDVSDAVALGNAALKKPDRDTPFNVWLGAWLYDVLAYDAGTLWRMRNRAGRTIGLRVIDGTTIAPLLDDWGGTPEPPAPAYVQYINGLPWGWHTTGDLIYSPFRKRPNSPYGHAPLESILLNANTDLRFQAYFLQRFTEGSIPAAFASAPETWTPDQIEAFQTSWDALMQGDQEILSQIKWIPGGGKIEWSNEKDFDDKFSLFLMRKTASMYHVVPADLGFTESVNKSSGETQSDVQHRIGDVPLAKYADGILTSYLQDDLRLPIKFQFDLGEEQDDRYQTAQADDLYVKMGAVGASEIRELRFGLPEPGGRPIPRYIFTTRGGPIPIAALEAVAGPVDQQTGAPEPGAPMSHDAFRPVEGVVPVPPLPSPPLAEQIYGATAADDPQAVGGMEQSVGKEGAPTAGITAATGITSYDLVGHHDDEDEAPATLPVVAKGADVRAAELAAFRRYSKQRRRLNRPWRDFAFTSHDSVTAHRLNDSGRLAVRKAAGQVAVAGLAVQAADTGRVLMLQRALDDDPAAGTWEFPGGHVEDNETPDESAAREWQEETGIALPSGRWSDASWTSPNGIYQGFVYVVASEDAVPMFDGRDSWTNPDDPDDDLIEAISWWDPAQLSGNPAVRPELLDSIDDVMAALGTNPAVPGLTKRSGMISLDLPDGTIEPAPGGVDDHHITVVYLGKDVDDEVFANACERARRAAASVPGPLSGTVGGLGTFEPSAGSDSKVPAFAPVSLPGIETLHAALEDLSASEHTDYHPHVTLAYLDDGDPLPDPVPATPVTFTHLTVHRGSDAVPFPLGRSGITDLTKATGDGGPKDQAPDQGPVQRIWPGWARDRETAAAWKPKIRATMAAALNTEQLARQWLSARPLSLRKDEGDDEAPGMDASDWVGQQPDLTAALIGALAGLLTALWTEGYAIGEVSATAVLAGSAHVDWSSWAPGDADAARLVLGKDGQVGLQTLLDKAGISIKSIANSHMDKLAKALSDALARGDSADTLAGVLRGILDDPTWAEMVAVTEIARATSAASMNTYRANGIEASSWLTSLDDRVCFPAGTVVATTDGPVPIELVDPGAIVVTPRGGRTVVAASSRPYEDGMTVIRSGGTTVAATDDHPFWTAGGWRRARDLSIGDLVQPLGKELAEIDCVVHIAFQNTHDTPSEPSKPRVPDRVPLTGMRVPIVAVGLQCNAEIKQCKVDGPARNALLLFEPDAQHGEGIPNFPFKKGLTLEPPAARHGAELPIYISRCGPQNLVAGSARNEAGRSPTSLGAEVPVQALLGAEAFSAAFAVHVLRRGGSASCGADDVPVRVRLRNSEGLLTDGADLLDACSVGSLVAFPSAVGPSGISATLRSERDPAPSAGARRVHDRSCVVAGVGAEGALRWSSAWTDELFVAVMAAVVERHGLGSFDVLIECDEPVQVYDIEVAEAHAFYANGLLVHNCQICEGNEEAGFVPLNAAFPSGDTSPPGHPICRCCLYPQVVSLADVDPADLAAVDTTND